MRKFKWVSGMVFHMSSFLFCFTVDPACCVIIVFKNKHILAQPKLKMDRLPSSNNNGMQPENDVNPPHSRELHGRWREARFEDYIRKTGPNVNSAGGAATNETSQSTTAAPSAASGNSRSQNVSLIECSTKMHQLKYRRKVF